MELTNTFSVPKPAETVWAALLDVERVAPCMPGASVDKVDGDDIHGSVRVKLGPITMRYKGVMTFSEKDERAHRAVVTAKAQETRGGGSVKATMTAQLTGSEESTEVTVATDLDVTGKAAQSGRGVMADASKQLVDQFARNLAQELESEAGPDAEMGRTAPSEAPAAGASAAGRSAASSAASSAGPSSTPPDDLADQSLNVLSLLREPARRLALPVAAGLVVGLLLGRLTKRASSQWPAAAHLPGCPRTSQP